MAPHAQLAARTSPDNHGPRVLPTRTPEVHTCSHFTVKKRFPDSRPWDSCSLAVYGPIPCLYLPLPQPFNQRNKPGKEKASGRQKQGTVGV